MKLAHPTKPASPDGIYAQGPYSRSTDTGRLRDHAVLHFHHSLVGVLNSELLVRTAHCARRLRETCYDSVEQIYPAITVWSGIACANSMRLRWAAFIYGVTQPNCSPVFDSVIDRVSVV